MLWNSSLVMQDLETRTLWSHILGTAMQGPLQGSELESIPSELVTWETWRKNHPDTTVLNLERTSRGFVKDVYKHPERYVYGLIVRGRVYHVPFPDLYDTPILNLKLQDEPLLLTFDPRSTAVHLYSRAVGDESSEFTPHEHDKMRDARTGTLWNRNTGIAITGALAGAQLKHRVGLVSFTRAWKAFHPGSTEISADSLNQE